MAFRYKKLWYQLIDHDMSLKSVRKALALSLDFISALASAVYGGGMIRCQQAMWRCI